MNGDRAEALERQVARVRESGMLGRSHGLSRLFDYLADPARGGATLREADVAQDVFGRELDLSGDASVRVYIHRLRKKLEGSGLAVRTVRGLGYLLEATAAP